MRDPTCQRPIVPGGPVDRENLPRQSRASSVFRSRHPQGCPHEKEGLKGPLFLVIMLPVGLADLVIAQTLRRMKPRVNS